MCALIIENNTAYRDLLDHTLAQRGFETDTDDSIESTGDEGVYKAKEHGSNQVVYVGLD